MTDQLQYLEYRWLIRCQQPNVWEPPRGLIQKKLVRKHGPCWGLTPKGEKLQRALLVEKALKRTP